MNITWKKRESNIIFPLISRLLGRISSGEEEKGKGTVIFEENQDFKNRGGEEYQVI